MTANLRFAAPELPNPSRRTGLVPLAVALIEVMLVFVVVHVSYRAFKRFTPPGRWDSAAGLNYTAGTTMILFTVGILSFQRRRFWEYGLTLEGWRSRLYLGVVLGVVVAATTILGVALVPERVRPAFLQPNNPATALAQGTRDLVLTLALLLVLRQSRSLPRSPASLSLALLGGFLALPLLVAWCLRQPLLPVVAREGWLFFCAGFGEEIFFRGYIQTRVDDAFGRRCRVLGLDLGLGLIVSSVLFGLIHALNPVDYFAGRFHFAWWSGLSSIFAGLFFGCLRERTGSILAGGVAHGLEDAIIYGLNFVMQSQH